MRTSAFQAAAMADVVRTMASPVPNNAPGEQVPPTVVSYSGGKSRTALTIATPLSSNNTWTTTTAAEAVPSIGTDTSGTSLSQPSTTTRTSSLSSRTTSSSSSSTSCALHIATDFAYLAKFYAEHGFCLEGELCSAACEQCRVDDYQSSVDMITWGRSS
jgi:hypothetical protein